jgi:hypothetical protein
MTSSPFDLKKVKVGHVVIVAAPDEDTSKYAFNVPGTELKAWIARITKVVKKGRKLTDTFKFEVVYGYNSQRDFTQKVTFDTLQKQDTLEMEDAQLYWVAENDEDEDFMMDDEDIQELTEIVKKMAGLEEEAD